MAHMRNKAARVPVIAPRSHPAGRQAGEAPLSSHTPPNPKGHSCSTHNPPCS